MINGDLALSQFEDKLAQSWIGNPEESALRAITVFYRIARVAAAEREADLILLDLGPNLGAINRSALLASQFVILPLAPDLASLQGLRITGPKLSEWRNSWADLKRSNHHPGLKTPSGEMTPLGYILTQHPRRGIISKKYEISAEYRELVVASSTAIESTMGQNANCLQTLSQYRNLIPLAKEAKKPIFHLKTRRRGDWRKPGSCLRLLD